MFAHTDETFAYLRVDDHSKVTDHFWQATRKYVLHKTIGVMKGQTHKAQIPNPALEKLANLIGEWKTVGTHPELPDKVFEGKTSFSWLEGGAFLLWRSEVYEKGFPVSIAIFGSDDATEEIFVLTFDERKVSRKYEVSVENNVVKWWRNAPNFSQRYSWTIADDTNTIIEKGELCQDGINWERDLEQTYTRIS